MSSPPEPQPTTGERPPSTQEIPVTPPTGGATTGGATAASKSLPPHPGAVTPAPVPVTVVQPTGPVDFVPGLPGLGTPPGPPPASVAPTPPATAPAPPATAVPDAQPAGAAPGPAAPSWPDTLESEVPARTKPRRELRALGRLDRSSLAGLGLAALAAVLVLLGVSLRFGTESFWSAIPLWSAFEVACAVLGLLALAAASANRLRKGPAERLVAGGLAGLAVFWVLVVLADVDSDRGFVFTAALACLGGALWIGPRPRT